jgi:phosphoribosylamine--glycine ligase
MGAYSPAPVVTEAMFKEILEKIVCRTIDGLAKEGIDYRGILYAGIMITKEGPKTLEFNARFGDPETQAVLPRLNSDILEIIMATAQGKLKKFATLGKLKWDKRACVCVVCASKGYPGDYEKGKEISGLDAAQEMKDIVIFHSGTRCRLDSEPLAAKFITNAGRVLGVTGLGSSITEAIDKTYKAVEKITFEGMHYRKDIGKKALSISQ